MDFSPDKLRPHFKALTKKREAIDKKLQPLRDELDELVAGDTDLTVKEAKAREEAIRKSIIKLQNDLYPIEMERASVARALGGKTG